MARQADLLPVEEAQQRILHQMHPAGDEDVELRDAYGRVLAVDVTSAVMLPPFANSSMDGFAVRSADTASAAAASPVLLAVTGHIAAGSWSDTVLQPGNCVRIMTGAPLPPGADAVVPFEEVDDRGTGIALTAPVSAHSCLRPAGNDVHSDQLLARAGTELNASVLALLAATGNARVRVMERPKVAVLSTGNELVVPGQELRPGEIYDSNTPMLVAAVAESGGEAVPMGPIDDDRDAIESCLREAVNCNLILTSGGASVGDFDFVKDVLGTAGQLGFWRVRVRPGKPLLFGSVRGTPLIGLPGNPTSAMVTFELFVRPALRAMLGTDLFRPEIEAVVDSAVENGGGRRTYARVRLEYRDGRFHAALSGPQDSAMLLPLSAADGLLVIPEECPELAAGSTGRVQVWRLPSGS